MKALLLLIDIHFPGNRQEAKRVTGLVGDARRRKKYQQATFGPKNKYGETGQKSLDKETIWGKLRDLYGRKALTEDG